MKDPLKEKEIEDIAFRMMFMESQSAKDVYRYLRKLGYNKSYAWILQFKNNVFQAVASQEHQEQLAESILKSVGRIEKEMSENYDTAKNVRDRLLIEGKHTSAINAIKEVHSQLRTGLQKLGEFKEGIDRIKPQKANIYSTQEYVFAMRNMIEDWFENMNADMGLDGKLIFNNPTPEIINSYLKWKREKKLMATVDVKDGS